MFLFAGSVPPIALAGANSAISITIPTYRVWGGIPTIIALAGANSAISITIPT